MGQSEPLEMVMCACGCGTSICRFDSRGRKRRFLRGHRSKTDSRRCTRLKKNGYVYVEVGMGHHLADMNGYALEHRLVIEEKLGRHLSKEEVAHHINGVRDDNRPENLSLFPSHREHIAHHRTAESEKNVNMVVAIREEYHSGGVTQSEVARKYNVSGRLVSNITAGQSYPNLPGPITRYRNSRAQSPRQLRGAEREALVVAIRERRASGLSAAVIADEYGITKGQVVRIVGGVSYPDLPGPIHPRRLGGLE